MADTGEIQDLTIGTIVLKWHPWVSWETVAKDARNSGGVSVPPDPGVYEVKHPNEETRLHIGKASDLRMRIKQGLVRGKVPHSTGKKLRENEDISRLLVRWAPTDRPAAAEEELHKRHVERFGRLLIYTQHT